MSKALTIQKQQAPVLESVDLYLSQIRKIPILSREEEEKIALEWFRHREPEEGRKLVMSNLRFVVKIAREYSRYGLRLNDLIQEGNMGLLHAVDKFDPRKGYRLISYAVWWIRAYIQAFILRSWSIVRVGTTRVQRRIFGGLQKARRMISSMNMGEAPENKKIAAVLNVTEGELLETMSRMAQRDVSLDQPVSAAQEMPFGDTLEDPTPNAEEILVASDLQEKVRAKLDGAYDDLSPRERYLLEHRLLADSPVTLEAAGHTFGVTRERVRQIEERLKGKLRTILTPAVDGGAHARP